MFFYLSEELFSGFLQFKCNFVDGQNNSKYRDSAPLNKTTNSIWCITRSVQIYPGQIEFTLILWADKSRAIHLLIVVTAALLAWYVQPVREGLAWWAWTLLMFTTAQFQASSKELKKGHLQKRNSWILNSSTLRKVSQTLVCCKTTINQTTMNVPKCRNFWSLHCLEHFLTHSFTNLATILHTFLLITPPTYICCFIHCMHFFKRCQGRRQQNWKGFPWRNTASLKFSVSQKWIFCSCCCYIFLLKMAFLKWNRVTVFLLFFFLPQRGLSILWLPTIPLAINGKQACTMLE